MPGGRCCARCSPYVQWCLHICTRTYTAYLHLHMYLRPHDAKATPCASLPVRPQSRSHTGCWGACFGRGGVQRSPPDGEAKGGEGEEGGEGQGGGAKRQRPVITGSGGRPGGQAACTAGAGLSFRV